jgi:acetyl-CoA acyltransferase 2
MENEIVIVSAKRTAVGSHGGSLSKFTPTDLGVFAAEAALKQSGVSPEQIDHIIFGNVLQSDGQTAYMPRHIGIRVGCKVETPALLVGRMCNSGYQAIISGAHQLLLNEADFILAGGSESMSQAPFLATNHRWGHKLGDCSLKDALVDVLTDQNAGSPMGITAEELATRYNISKEECDRFAYESQTKAGNAIKEGKFKDEIVPIEIKGRKGDVTVFDHGL